MEFFKTWITKILINECNSLLKQRKKIVYIDNYTEELKSNSAEYIANSVAITIVRVGTWIGLFLVARVIMIFLKIFASVIEKIPVVKQFNKARRNCLWST